MLHETTERKVLQLIFSDTPIDAVDEISGNLPEIIRIYSDGELIYEFAGFTRAVRLEKNVSNKQVLLWMERSCQ